HVTHLQQADCSSRYSLIATPPHPISPLSLHDALPIFASPALRRAASTLWGMPLNANGEIIGVLVVGFTKPYEWLPTEREMMRAIDRKSTRLNSSHRTISYAVFCLKK